MLVEGFIPRKKHIFTCKFGSFLGLMGEKPLFWMKKLLKLGGDRITIISRLLPMLQDVANAIGFHK